MKFKLKFHLIYRILLGLLFLFCLNTNDTTSHSAEKTLTLEQLKAAFIYNFSLFVEWPPHAFEDEHTPIIIGILGDDPFGESLDNALKGKLLKERSYHIKRSKWISDIADSHILYISPSAVNDLKSILNKISGKAVLTIGDYPGLASKGVMFNFYTENEKVRFEININAVREARLNVSSKLLRLGKIIGDNNYDKND